jgi:hypothetical protein
MAIGRQRLVNEFRKFFTEPLKSTIHLPMSLNITDSGRLLRRTKFPIAIEGSWKVFIIGRIVTKSLQPGVFIKCIDTFSQEFQGKLMVVNTKNLSIYSMHQSKY